MYAHRSLQLSKTKLKTETRCEKTFYLTEIKTRPKTNSNNIVYLQRKHNKNIQ